jgi:hypothetical protein
MKAYLRSSFGRYSGASTLLSALAVVLVALLLAFAGGNTPVTAREETKGMNGPWVNMGNDIRQVCEPAFRLEYEWGITYNNASPVIRVICTQWNTGSRITTYPPYPTGDVQPFTWGGIVWIYNTASSLDNACSIAYHGYYYEDGMGRYYMTTGNGCDALPTVWRRRL